jgi:hypothetical protein
MKVFKVFFSHFQDSLAMSDVITLESDDEGDFSEGADLVYISQLPF